MTHKGRRDDETLRETLATNTKGREGFVDEGKGDAENGKSGRN